MTKKRIAVSNEELVAVTLREVSNTIAKVILQSAKQPVTTALLSLGFKLNARANELDPSGARKNT